MGMVLVPGCFLSTSPSLSECIVQTGHECLVPMGKDYKNIFMGLEVGQHSRKCSRGTEAVMCWKKSSWEDESKQTFHTHFMYSLLYFLSLLQVLVLQSLLLTCLFTFPLPLVSPCFPDFFNKYLSQPWNKCWLLWIMWCDTFAASL